MPIFSTMARRIRERFTQAAATSAREQKEKWQHGKDAADLAYLGFIKGAQNRLEQQNALMSSVTEILLFWPTRPEGLTPGARQILGPAERGKGHTFRHGKWTVGHALIAHGANDVLEQLLSKGLNPNHPLHLDTGKGTLLEFAIATGNEPAGLALLRHGAESIVRKPLYPGVTQVCDLGTVARGRGMEKLAGAVEKGRKSPLGRLFGVRR